MKRKKNAKKIILLMIFLLSFKIDILAMNTGLSTEEMESDKVESILSHINLSVLSLEPVKDAIDCFDVNEKGMIAIGTSDSEKKTICIYSSDGIFQYGYRFNSYGSFGIKWEEDNIIIYFVRGDFLVEVDTNGIIEKVLDVSDTLENGSYRRNSIFATKREVGDSKYVLKNDMGILNLFASTYSQLVITNNKGETEIFYDVNATELPKMIVTVIGVIVFAGSVIVILIRQTIIGVKNYNDTTKA